MGNPLLKLPAVLLRIPDGSGGTDEITFDATTSEQHSLTSTITDHPVEQGFNVSDHSRPEPRKVTLECWQSNTPLVGEVDGLRDYQLWQRFIDLWRNPRLVEIVTIRDSYTSMAVESVTSPVDVKSANALKFSVSLKEIRVISNKFTQVKIAKAPKAQTKKKVGKVPVRDKPIDTTTQQKLAEALTPYGTFGSAEYQPDVGIVSTP